MLKLPSPDQAERLREFFAAAHYTSEQLRDRMGLNVLPSRRLRTLPLMLDRTREPTVLNILARWFFIGVPAEKKLASGLIPEPVLNALLETGALARQAGRLVPAIRITPVEKLLIVSDSALDNDSKKPSDLVLWPNPTTGLLSRFTVRNSSRRTLDLGAGCGLQSLEAARHSETVVATDLNAKATLFAAFNARLNGVENIEFLTGDTFEPVAGQKFDLIVANPPFFITPSKQYMFCDNNMDLDQYCRRLAREAPSYLNDGGWFQMLCEWVQVEGQPWQDRVSEWLVGSGCDAWVIKGSTADPSTYAHNRFRDSAPYSRAQDNASFAEWMNYYRAQKVEAIHGGMIAMRRRLGSNWIRIDETVVSPRRPFGSAVVQMFANRDFLQEHASDEQMLATRVRISPHAQLDQQFRPLEGQWQHSSSLLRLIEGIPFSLPLQPLVAEFVGSCSGNRTLGESIEELEGKVKASPEQVRRECLGAVRQLMERGFIWP
jgi:methylase of polypeptide subunit release factors